MSNTTASETRTPPQVPQGWQYEAPARKAEYVAYDRRPVQVPDAQNGGTLEFRPSVFVREFVDVKIKSARRKSTPVKGEPFEYGEIEIDPSTIKLNDEGAVAKYAVGGSIAVGPAFDLLEKAQQHQAPVNVIIEVQRKPKNDDGVAVERTASILALRGVTDPDNDLRGNSNVTKSNCKSVVVAAAPVGRPDLFAATHECRSEPSEWEQLRRNYKGAHSPAGWRIFDGGIVRASAAPSGAGGVDVNDIAEAVAKVLLPQIQASAPAESHFQSKGGTRPSHRGNSHSEEAQPFKSWNTDGRLNPGSYAVAKDRAVFEEAFELVRAAHGGTITDVDAAIDQAQKAKAKLLWLGDAVQVAATGMPKPDRMANSSREAGMWVKTVYKTIPGYEPVLDGSDCRDWLMRVKELATSLYRQALADTEAALDPQATQEPSQNAPAPQQNAAQQMTADKPELAERYKALLEHVGGLTHPQDYQPLIAATFNGATSIGAVPAQAFEQRLSEWEANTDGFQQAAQQAYNNAQG